MPKEQTDPTKIKQPVKPLTGNQRWNVFVRILPWGLILGFALYFFGTYVGHYQTVNTYNHEASIKAEAIKTAQSKE